MRRQADLARCLERNAWRLALAAVAFMWSIGGVGFGAEATRDQTFAATLVDTTGLETEVSTLVFYWEEELSETQVALHALTHVPAKRGSVPINIQFTKIQEIAFKTQDENGQPVLSITLKSGKTGDFHLAIPGSFKGETDFGDVIAKPAHLKKIVFK